MIFEILFLPLTLVWDLQAHFEPIPSRFSNRCLEAMDFSYEHAEEIEKEIFNQIANLFDLQADLVFYDTTTASFFVDYEEEEDSEGNRRADLSSFCEE